MQHRRAGNVARRQQPQAEAVAHQRNMEGHGLQAVGRETKAATEQGGGHRRAPDGVMTGEVIGVGVGDKSAWLWIPWVQPQVGLRQVKAALEPDFYQKGMSSSSWNSSAGAAEAPCGGPERGGAACEEAGGPLWLGAAPPPAWFLLPSSWRVSPTTLSLLRFLPVSLSSQVSRLSRPSI